MHSLRFARWHTFMKMLLFFFLFNVYRHLWRCGCLICSTDRKIQCKSEFSVCLCMQYLLILSCLSCRLHDHVIFMYKWWIKCCWYLIWTFDSRHLEFLSRQLLDLTFYTPWKKKALLCFKLPLATSTTSLTLLRSDVIFYWSPSRPIPDTVRFSSTTLSTCFLL